MILVILFCMNNNCVNEILDNDNEDMIFFPVCPRGVMGITVLYIICLYSPLDIYVLYSPTRLESNIEKKSICFLFNLAVIRDGIKCTYVICCNGQYLGPTWCRVILSIYYVFNIACLPTTSYWRSQTAGVKESVGQVVS